MESLETELERARELRVDELADAVQRIGFECTRCGACCRGENEGNKNEGSENDWKNRDGSDEGVGVNESDHTATIFPEEVRTIQAAGEYDWRDVARPMPFGLSPGEEGLEGETFEWAIQTTDCGDCTFYRERDGVGRCAVHPERPLICRTYPFSVDFGTTEPMGATVDREGPVRAHECEGLGRDIDREDALSLAETLKTRTIRELEEAIALRDEYEPAERAGVIVHDSEGAKRPDGRSIDR